MFKALRMIQAGAGGFFTRCFMGERAPAACFGVRAGDQACSRRRSSIKPSRTRTAKVGWA